MFSCEFCKIFKNTVFYRTRPVAASERFIVVWNVQSQQCQVPWTVEPLMNR